MISKLSLTIIPNFEEGEVLLINKELDWTSFDVVNSIKAFLKYELGIKIKLVMPAHSIRKPQAYDYLYRQTDKVHRKISIS